VNITPVMFFSVEKGQESILSMDADTDRDKQKLKSNTDDSKKIQTPDFIFPVMNATVDMTKRESITFRWQSLKNATQYNIRLYHTEKDPGNLLTQASVEKSEFTLENLSILDTGNFVCTVEAYHGKELLADSNVSFRIVLKQNLKAPESIKAKKKVK
jgi:hypothetical protein